MGKQEKTKVTVETTVYAPVEKVWQFWTDPIHIISWNAASDDWHTTKSENDLRTGGKFLSRMESRDGKEGFDFTGEYTRVENLKQIEYRMDDGREVQVSFIAGDGVTTVVETFDAEEINPVPLQREGWQAILDNFKNFVEESGIKETLLFEITINAPRDKVYKTILDEKHFREWTSDFNENSHFIGNWEPGSKMLFIGADKQGNEEGMVGIVRENIALELVSVEYTHTWKNGVETPLPYNNDPWAEYYKLTADNGNTLLTVRLDTNKEFLEYFKQTYPKALKKLKAICEK